MQNETDGVDLAELSQQGYASLKEGQFDEAGHQFQAVLDQDPVHRRAIGTARAREVNPRAHHTEISQLTTRPQRTGKQLFSVETGRRGGIERE